MFTTTPINGRQRGVQASLHGRPVNIPSQPLRRSHLGVHHRSIGSPRRAVVDQADTHEEEEDDDDDDDADLIPRTPRKQPTPRRLYRDTPVPRKEKSVRMGDDTNEGYNDLTVPILPSHDYDDVKEVEDLEEEYSRILQDGVVDGDGNEEEEEKLDEKEASNMSFGNSTTENSFERRKIRSIDTSIIEDEENERSPFLQYLIDPFLDVFKRAFTIAFLTVRFFFSPFLKKRVLSFIFMTVALVSALIISSIGIFYGLKMGKNLLVTNRSHYSPPQFVPENMDELNDRLMNVEKEVESLSRVSSTLQAGLKGNAENTKEQITHLDGELKDIIKGLSQLSTDFSIVNKQVDDYSTVADEIQGNFKQLSDSLYDLQKVVTGQQTETSDLREIISEHGDAISQSLQTIQKSTKEIESLQTRMGYLERAKNSEQSIMDILDEYLPSKMVVYRDHSNEITAIPEFWSFLDSILQEKFSTALDSLDRDFKATPQQPPKVDWNEFLKYNQKAIEALVQSNLDDSLHSVVSKEEFQQVIANKLTAFRDELTDELEHLDKKIRLAIEYKPNVDPGKFATGLALESLIRDNIEAYHSKSVVAKPDFASLMNGARVDRPNTSKTYSPHLSRSLLYRMARGVTSLAGFGRIILNPPEAALNEETSVGSCWPFAGSSGKLGVVLASEMYPSEISIEHIPSKVSLNPSTAPKTISFWIRITDNLKRQSIKDIITQPQSSDLPKDYVKVLTAQYDVHTQRGAQIFSIPYAVQKIAGLTNKVVVEIEDNWGNPHYTCLYKVRVYGDTEMEKSPVNDSSQLYSQLQPNPDLSDPESLGNDDSFGNDDEF